jgi:hypothetical protein
VGYFFFPEENPTAITATIKLAKPIIRLIPSYIENIASPPFTRGSALPHPAFSYTSKLYHNHLTNTNICSILSQNSPFSLFLKFFRLTKENTPFLTLIVV